MSLPVEGSGSNMHSGVGLLDDVLDPLIDQANVQISTGESRDARIKINDAITELDQRTKILQARLEGQLRSLGGNGLLSGGDFEADAGLSVVIHELEAFVGHYLFSDDDIIIGGLNGSDDNYLYLRQDGTFTVVPTTNVAPSTDDGHGEYCYLGSATTSSSAVTAVDLTERTVHPSQSGSASVDVAGTGDVSATVAEARKKLLLLTGALTGNRSYILPHIPGNQYLIKNGTSGAHTLTVKGPTGTGQTITQGDMMPVTSDGTNFLAVSAESPF